jgi:hypothetical protein
VEALLTACPRVTADDLAPRLAWTDEDREAAGWFAALEALA